MNNKSNARLYQLNHCTYNCVYHVVWVTKYRQRFFDIEYNKKVLKKMLRAICRWKGIVIKGWYIGEDHVHMYIVIPPKYSVSYVLNVLKGKSSGWIKKSTKQLPSGSVWSRGYFVTTTGVNEYVVKKYMRVMVID